MSISLLHEQPFPIAELPDLVERKTGHRPSIGAVNAWVYKGVQPVGGGEPVRLEVVRLGRRRMTTADAWLRFIARINGEEA